MMFDPICTPLPALAASRDDDRFLELLDCLADLRVEAGKQRHELSEVHGTDDPRVRAVVDQFRQVESSLAEVSVKAASIHQMAQRFHLI
jgi:hypothetical protein